jgi:type I restriction-modification system DNA methylase subunit
MHKQTSVNKIYDLAAGSGSLLLQAKKHFDAHIIEDGFFGQEINHTTYNLARMNMFLHNINYDKFNIQLGNTLTDDHVARIMEVFDTKENVPHFALSVAHTTIAEKDYNLSVSTYVEAKDNREVVDITELNAELKTTVAKIDRLRADIDAIVAEIEGSKNQLP